MSEKKGPFDAAIAALNVVRMLINQRAEQDMIDYAIRWYLIALESIPEK